MSKELFDKLTSRNCSQTREKSTKFLNARHRSNRQKIVLNSVKSPTKLPKRPLCTEWRHCALTSSAFNQSHALPTERSIFRTWRNVSIKFESGSKSINFKQCTTVDAVANGSTITAEPTEDILYTNLLDANQRLYRPQPHRPREQGGIWLTNLNSDT